MKALVAVLVAAVSLMGRCSPDTGMIAGVDPDRVFLTGGLAGWEPVDGPLDAALPVPWPDRYVNKYGQAFNPWTFRQNAALLCGYAREHDPADIAGVAGELVARMLEYTTVDGDARFVVYDFDYMWRDVTLERGWVSAFGNGAAITGLVVLSDCLDDPGLLEHAMELFGAFTANGSPLTEDLGDGTLWFEEYPIPGEPNPRVLNGHIVAVLGMYYLWDATGDPVVLDYLERGVEAVAVHGHEYRVPGQVNRYDLRDPYYPDYGPARTINQQDQLCLITGDGRFRELRDLFADDMPEHAETLTLRCV